MATCTCSNDLEICSESDLTDFHSFKYRVAEFDVLPGADEFLNMETHLSMNLFIFERRLNR